MFGANGKSDLKKPPTIHGITMTLTEMARLLHSREKINDQFVPVYLQTIQSGFVALVDECRLRYPGWQMSLHDAKVAQNTFAHLGITGAVRDHRGVSNSPSLTFREAVLVTNRYIQSVLDSPGVSFDAVCMELLALSIFVATGAAPCDLGWLPEDSPAEALQLWESDLCVVDNECIGGLAFGRFSLTLTFKITRGTRSRDSTPVTHEPRPLRRPENAILDPIVNLLCVLRRRGLLVGTTDEILDRASRDPQGRVQFDRTGPLFLEGQQTWIQFCRRGCYESIPVCWSFVYCKTRR